MMRFSRLLFLPFALFLAALFLVQCSVRKGARSTADISGDPDAWNQSIALNANEMLEKGKAVFRFETFGDEAFWTDKLQLHRERDVLECVRGLMDKKQYPVAARMGFGNKRSAVDMVSDKLAALQFYQLAMPAPKPPKNSYNEDAARRGEMIFMGKAQCATCHVPPLFTEPGWSGHKAEDICIDDWQAKRSPDGTYVTQGLKGLWTHMKGGFYHDGRFATLMDVVNHYDACKSLSLTVQEKGDLVKYLKSL